jgi:hypothetical protein
MIFPRVVLWSCLAGASAVLADYNITVDDSDPRVQYTGSWSHGSVSAPFSPPSTFDSSFIGATEDTVYDEPIQFHLE